MSCDDPVSAYARKTMSYPPPPPPPPWERRRLEDFNHVMRDPVTSQGKIIIPCLTNCECWSARRVLHTLASVVTSIASPSDLSCSTTTRKDVRAAHHVMKIFQASAAAPYHCAWFKGHVIIIIHAREYTVRGQKAWDRD